MVVAISKNCVGDHPELCPNCQCDVNEDKEREKTASPACVHSHSHLRNWWILKDKAPDHDEVDEDVEDGKDEEAVVQVLEAAAAARYKTHLGSSFGSN